MLKYKDIKKAHVELSSFCNSSCPTCPRNTDGGIINPGLVPNSLSLEDFKTIFPKDFLMQLEEINFCGNYGDPLMCKDIEKILIYISRMNSNLSITIHTNGGMRDVKFWNKFALFSRTFFKFEVIFSIDGLEDTNHLYRIGVNWNKVIENAKSFIDNGGPAIWDFLVFKHNEHQLDEAKVLSKKLGFKEFKEGNPHGFKYNGKIRVVDQEGKFERFIEQSSKFKFKIDINSAKFEKTDFDLTKEQVKINFEETKDISLNTQNKFHMHIAERLKNIDNIEIKSCMAKDDKEIYVDSNGGIHPCCYLGHINQDALSIVELVLHKKWIEDRIGLDKINALITPINEILDSNYFELIEKSWVLTFEQGRNPMCVMKCGVQRPMGVIRVD
jgi:MoaA/NifB/PqqE/SkfB family radical SAM enzyme